MRHRRKKEASPWRLVVAPHQPAGNQRFFYMKIFSNANVNITLNHVWNLSLYNLVLSQTPSKSLTNRPLT